MSKRYPIGINGNQRREKIFDHYSSQPNYISEYEPALVQLVTLITDAEDLRTTIDAEGSIYVCGNMKRPHPAVAMLRTVQSSIISYAGKFGLTPSDAKALSKGVEKDEDFSDFDDL